MVQSISMRHWLSGEGLSFGYGTVYGFGTSLETSIDIDTEFDFVIAEALLRYNQ